MSISDEDLAALSLLCEKYPEEVLFAAVKKLKRPPPRFKSDKRGRTSDSAVRDLHRWLAVKRMLAENPKLNDAYARVATDIGVDKSIIRRAYRRIEDSFNSVIREDGSVDESNTSAEELLKLCLPLALINK